MVRAGTLNKIVEIRRLVTGTATFFPDDELYPDDDLYPDSSTDNSLDEYGGAREVYTSLGTVRASINPIDGQEDFLNGTKNEVSHKIGMRYNPNLPLLNEDIIVYGGRTFEVEYILNWNERNSNVTVLAKEKFLA